MDGTPAQHGRVRWAIGFLAAALYLALGLTRWNAGIATSFDLAAFSQTARSWASGRLPYSGIVGRPLLGDHFSPVTALFGVAWRIWPDPRVLLIVQALCLGLAVAWVFAYAHRTLGLRWAVALLPVAVLSRGIVGGSLFDVHEVAFAAPATVALGIAVRTARLRVAVVAAVVLALTKEDLGVTVIAAGACWYLVHRRLPHARRDVLVLVGIGAAAVAIAAAVIHGVNGSSAFTHYFSLATMLHGSPARWLPVGVFALSCCLVGLRSPLAMMAVPTLAWRCLSGNTLYWSTELHYDLVTWAVAMVAAVDGIRRLPASWDWRAVPALAGTVSIALGVLTVQHRWGGVGALTTTSTTVRQIDALAARLPTGARVAVTNAIGPYVVARTETYGLGSGLDQPVDYAFYTESGPWASDFGPCARARLELAARVGHWPVWREGRFVLVHLGDPTAATTAYDACR